MRRANTVRPYRHIIVKPVQNTNSKKNPMLAVTVLDGFTILTFFSVFQQNVSKNY